MNLSDDIYYKIYNVHLTIYKYVYISTYLLYYIYLTLSFLNKSVMFSVLSSATSTCQPSTVR